MNPVYFYVPNIVGYFRALLLPFVLIFGLTNPVVTFACYFVSAMLDAVDGNLARRLNQESKLGRIIDYSVDRVSISIILLMLAVLYRQYWWFFASIMAIEMASHYAHLYSTVFSNQQHHKSMVEDTRGTIRLYYTNRAVMFLSCFCHDMWLGVLYLHYFYRHQVTYVVLLVFLPGFIFKTWIHVMQMVNAMNIVARRDVPSPR